MRLVFSMSLAAGLILLVLGGCDIGNSRPGTGGGEEGGAGGEIGEGGGGGSIVNDLLPTVSRVEPSQGPPGLLVTVHGSGFNGTISAKNQIVFAGSPSSRVVEVDKGGKWFTAYVPKTAQTGPISVVVDHGSGAMTVEGPVFTVNSDYLRPAINSLAPPSVLVGTRDLTVQLLGRGFAPEVTTVTVGGVEVPVDWTRATDVSLFVPVPNDQLDLPAKLEVIATNPTPGGGSSDPRIFEVSQPLRLVTAYASSPTMVQFIFNQPLGDEWTENSAKSHYSVDGFVTVAMMPSERGVQITLNEPTISSKVYEAEVSARVESANGDSIQTRRVPFWGFNSVAHSRIVFGERGCGDDQFVQPSGFAIGPGGLYVTETGGNRVRVLTADLWGSFLDWYGSDGSTNGRHSSGEAAGCEGGPTADAGLDGPTGPVAFFTDDSFFVADTAHDRILKYNVMSGASTVVATELTRPMLLGAWFDTMFVRTGTDQLLKYSLSSNRFEEPPLGGPGTANGEFAFNDEDGLPAMAGSYLDGYFVVDPGNHRVQKFAPNFAPLGSLGVGSTGFGTATCMPGDGPAEFTSPSGIAMDGTGYFFVVDQAKGGRLQRIDTQGNQIWELPLGFSPAGLAFDPPILWIGDRTNSRVVYFRI